MLKIIGGFFLLVMLTACGSRQLTTPVHQTNPPDSNKALYHYRSGALYDFQDQYKSALVEYHRALIYDSSSAQILKAIGRDFFRIGQYSNAIDYLRRSMHRNPEDKETLYFLAETYYKTHNYENALRYNEALNNLDPYNATVHANLAYLYTKLGKITKLVALREKIVEMLGYQSEAAYQLLTLFMQLQQIDKAADLVKNMIDEDPNEPSNWIIYGNILELKDQSDQAISAYQKALDLQSANEKTLRQIYSIYANRHDWEGLVQTFETIVEKNPETPLARLYLAEGYFNRENYQEARFLLEALKPEAELSSQVSQLLGRIAASENKTDEARAHFRTITESDPWNSSGWEYLAVLYFQEQQYDKCLAVLEDALKAIPNEANLLSLYGTTLYQLSRHSAALEPLRKANKLDPDDFSTIVTLSLVYDHLKIYPALDSLYESALKKFPNNSLLLNNYSYSLCERGKDLQLALEMSRQAVTSDPDNGAYLDTFGWIHYQLGDYEEALRLVKRAVDLQEDNAEVLEHLGDIYFKLDEIELARQYWQQALAQDPENASLRKKLGESGKR